MIPYHDDTEVRPIYISPLEADLARVRSEVREEEDRRNATSSHKSNSAKRKATSKTSRRAKRKREEPKDIFS